MIRPSAATSVADRADLPVFPRLLPPRLLASSSPLKLQVAGHSAAGPPPLGAKLLLLWRKKQNVISHFCSASVWMYEFPLARGRVWSSEAELWLRGVSDYIFFCSEDRPE